MKVIKLKSDFYRGKEIVLVISDFIKEIKEDIIFRFKSLEWHPELKQWFIYSRSDVLDFFFSQYRGKFYIDYKELNRKKSLERGGVKPKDKIKNNLPPLNAEQIKAIEIMERYMVSNRNSKNTINTYCDAMKTFLRFNHNKKIMEITTEDITRFNVEYIIKNGLSNSFQNQVINAIKLFYRIYNGSKMEIEEIERPRREHKLPNVLSKEEVKQILNSLENEKHKMMLTLIYACGLRRSELLNLTFSDINSSRNLLTIRQSKGKKDRVVPISDHLIELLREYYKKYRPQKWLFEGQVVGGRYSEKSLESVLKKALFLAGIKKPVTLHWLRHSYATHLLEKGTDLRYIQELLGHRSSRTTEIYTHVSIKSIEQIRSPFDDL